MSCPAVDLNNRRQVRLRTSPAWLPRLLHGRKERIRIKFKPTVAERRIFRKRPNIKPSVWAPKYRTVTYGPLEGSKWDPNFIPHMNGIMDASFYPSVREIGNCKAPQGASSAGLETMLGFISDIQPGPALFTYPDRDTASKRCTDYLQPMFRKSGILRSLLTGIQDDMASLRIKLKTMLIYMAWAGSATALGNVSVRYLVLDEIDKYKDNPNKKEGDIIGYARQRVRAFKYGSKIWFSSTPTDESGHINKFMTEDAQVIFDYWVPCPDCGQQQLMVFDQIMKSFDKGMKDPRRMDKEKLAGYVCEYCGSIWDDRKRDKAVISAQHDGWRARVDGREMWDYLQAENPEKICFHSPSWISPLVPLSEVAAVWLKGLRDPESLKTFMNQYKAEPWTYQGQKRKEDQILLLRDDRPAGLVPGGGQVAALVAGVDTQDDGFYYEIRAVGWGLVQESWQIKAGFVTTFEALAKILFEFVYMDSSGLVYPVHLAVQDAMGHRTSEVYDFCRSWPGRVIPYKGAQRKTAPISTSRIDCYPGTKKPIPGGVLLYHADTTYFKNALARKLEINPSDPGAWHLNREATEEFALQMCAESPDEKGIWQCPKGRPNHYWDCSFMTLVAAEILEIRLWEKTEPAQTPKKKKQTQTTNPYTGGSSLFGGRGN